MSSFFYEKRLRSKYLQKWKFTSLSAYRKSNSLVCTYLNRKFFDAWSLKSDEKKRIRRAHMKGFFNRLKFMVKKRTEQSGKNLERVKNRHNISVLKRNFMAWKTKQFHFLDHEKFDRVFKGFFFKKMSSALLRRKLSRHQTWTGILSKKYYFVKWKDCLRTLNNINLALIKRFEERLKRKTFEKLKSITENESIYKIELGSLNEFKISKLYFRSLMKRKATEIKMNQANQYYNRKLRREIFKNMQRMTPKVVKLSSFWLRAWKTFKSNQIRKIFSKKLMQNSSKAMEMVQISRAFRKMRKLPEQNLRNSVKNREHMLFVLVFRVMRKQTVEQVSMINIAKKFHCCKTLRRVFSTFRNEIKRPIQSNTAILIFNAWRRVYWLQKSLQYTSEIIILEKHFHKWQSFSLALVLRRRLLLKVGFAAWKSEKQFPHMQVNAIDFKLKSLIAFKRKSFSDWRMKKKIIEFSVHHDYNLVMRSFLLWKNASNQSEMVDRQSSEYFLNRRKTKFCFMNWRSLSKESEFRRKSLSIVFKRWRNNLLTKRTIRKTNQRVYKETFSKWALQYSMRMLLVHSIEYRNYSLRSKMLSKWKSKYKAAKFERNAKVMEIVNLEKTSNFIKQCYFRKWKKQEPSEKWVDRQLKQIGLRKWIDFIK